MNEHDYNQPTIPPTSLPEQHDSEIVSPSNSGTFEDSPTVLGQSDSNLELAATIDWARPVAAKPDVHPKVRYFGEYELLEEIARGGMGVVYKAKQTKLNRLVALKMILSGQLAGDDDVKRFHTEAEAAANMDHPGIVPIYEVGEYEGQHYFSMAFVHGPSLNAAITNGPLPPKEAALIVKAVTDAMAYAHDRGVIHRDLKPANILLANVDDKRPTAVFLTAEGIEPGWYEPKVTDFGLAKKTEGDSQLTGTGQILGTPSYMPPEQAAGKTEEIGPLADVYSLGAILYCLLTGRPPFQSAYVMDTLIQVLEHEPVPVRHLTPDVPIDLETICLKCLQKDQKLRYTSAKELTKDLRRFINGEPIEAAPISHFERLFKYAKRRPGTTCLASAIIVLTSLLLFPLSTLDSNILGAYAHVVSKSSPWFALVLCLLALFLLRELLFVLVVKLWRSLVGYSKESDNHDTPTSVEDRVLRALLIFTIGCPSICVLMLLVQIIRYLHGEKM